MFCERIHQKMMLFLRRKLWKRQLKGISPELIDLPLAEIDKLLRVSLIEKSLQDIYASSQMRGQGEDFCVRGMLWLREYKHIPPFPFKGFFWENMPPKDTDWYWALHAFSFFSGLLAYHRHTSDDRALNIAREGMESWCVAYLHRDGKYPKSRWVWHDHGTAMRAQRLVLFLAHVLRHAPEWAKRHAKFCRMIWHTVLIHGNVLARDNFYAAFNNHGLYQARVLLFLGSLVPEWLEGRRWQMTAARRIKGELDYSFTEEGVHKENSPSYHVFMIWFFAQIGEDFFEQLGEPLVREIGERIEKALEFLAYIQRPDGKLPIIGDTTLKQADKFQDMFDVNDKNRNYFKSDSRSYQEFLYALMQGRQGYPPKKLQMVYPRSGYAIFRDSWPDAGTEYGNAVHCIVKAGCLALYHWHKDEGHFVISAFGEDWIIDSGQYKEDMRDPMRQYMRSRQGHNVPLVADATYDEDNPERRLTAWEVTDYDDDDDTPYIAMDIRVLLPVKYMRKIAYDRKAHIFVIDDDITLLDESERKIIIQFHVPLDKTVVRAYDGALKYDVLSQSGHRMSIEILGETPDEMVVIKGKTKTGLRSYVSYQLGKVEESQVLQVIYHKRNTVALRTILRLHPRGTGGDATEREPSLYQKLLEMGFAPPYAYTLELFETLNSIYSQNPLVPKPRQYTPQAREERASRNVGILAALIPSWISTRCLEIGCGSGDTCAKLAQSKDCSVAGVDIVRPDSWDDYADINNLTLMRIDLTREPLPFAAASFDLIYSWVVFEHVEHPERMLEVIRRLLKPGGVFHMTTNFYSSPIASHCYREVFFPWPHILFEDNVFTAFYKKHHGRDNITPEYVNRMTPDAYIGKMEQLGFTIESVERSGRPYDEEFKNCFSDKLGKYPDTELNFDILTVTARAAECKKVNP